MSTRPASIAPQSPAVSAAFKDVPIVAASRYQPLVLVLVAVSLGMVADRLALPVVPHSFQWWWAIATIAFLVWLVCWRFSRLAIAAIAIFICVAAIGGAWHHARWNLFGANDLGRYVSEAPQPICLEAVAMGAPREIPAPVFDPLRTIPAGSQSRLSVEVVQIRNGMQWQPASGKAQLSILGEPTGIRAGEKMTPLGHEWVVFGPLQTSGQLVN